MTSITRNLPWFVKDLGVAIVGQECYRSLVEELNVTDVPCLKYSLSKGLGIGIVAGGSIMKVPQLFLILNAQSARGLSLSAYVLETLSYAITLTYSMRNQFPFSTYGENLFLTIQNVIITFLIAIYAPSLRSSSSSKLVPLTIGTVAAGAALYFVPPAQLALLQVGTLPLSLFSKLPQIRQNARAKSTGQLSAFAVISQVLGCLARLFTTATEVGDSIVAAGFALALLLNIVLGVQLWSYWGSDVELRKKDKDALAGFGNGTKSGEGVGGIRAGEDQKRNGESISSDTVTGATTGARLPSTPIANRGERVVSGSDSRGGSRPGTPTPQWQQRVATPPIPSSPSGRKWARKLDGKKKKKKDVSTVCVFLLVFVRTIAYGRVILFIFLAQLPKFDQ